MSVAEELQRRIQVVPFPGGANGAQTLQLFRVYKWLLSLEARLWLAGRILVAGAARSTLSSSEDSEQPCHKRTPLRA